MKSITKKRVKAYVIDVAVSTAVTMGVEYFLRKRIKNEAVHALVTPTLVMWSLEYAQLRRNGQTFGYKQAGLVLEGKQDSKVSSGQIVKRMAYRDTLSTFKYIKDFEDFEKSDGAILPHDLYARTVVKEV